MGDMNNESNSWNQYGKFLLALAIVLGITSLAMNLLSHALESQETPQASAESEFWLAEEKTNVINILAAGGIQPCSEATPEGVFSGLGNLVNNYELSAVSFRALVGTNTSSAFANQVQEVGFDLFGLAYPGVHAYGKDAIDSSMAYWNNTNVRTNGTFSSTDEKNILRIAEENGISAVYLSYTDTLDDELPENETYLVNVYDDEKSPLFVNKAAEQADIVIVSIAWEGGQGALPNDRQKEIAQALAGAGASIIIGYADNSVQPACWIDDTLVFYSLGNLYSEDKETTDRIGALGAVTVTETIYGDKHRIELTNPRMDLVVSVPEEGAGMAVRLLSQASDEEVEDRKELYDGYVQTIQRMDDSIRIGGLK